MQERPELTPDDPVQGLSMSVDGHVCRRFVSATLRGPDGAVVGARSVLGNARPL